MFGEYGLYLGDKFVGVVGDEHLYVKITAGSRGFLDPSHDAPPYPGARPYLNVPEGRWGDIAWLSSLLTAVAADLAAPKPKPPRKRPDRTTIGWRRMAPARSSRSSTAAR